MDDATREQVHELAEKHGLDPEVLEVALGGVIPDDLEQVMAQVLKDLGIFSRAADELD